MYIKGVGMTRFDYTQKPWWGYAYEAALDALKDAKMDFPGSTQLFFRRIFGGRGGAPDS